MARLTPTRPGLVLSIVAVLLISTGTAALAAWPHDPDFGNLPVCTAALSQYQPAMIADGAGGAFIAWYDYRSGGTADLYAQRVSAAGVPLWTANGVAVCVATNSQTIPVIALDGAGGVIIAWEDFRGGINNDIYAQRLNAAGVPQWTADGVALCTAGNEQINPTIVSDGAGGAIVTWQDLRAGAANDIYAQRVNAAGAPQWTPNGVAICTAVFNQLTPTIATDGAGGAIITWYDIRNGANYDIYAQRLNAAGVPQWSADGNAICTAASSQASPTIVSDGLGGAIIAWQDFRSGTTYDVYAQRVTPSGGNLWGANGVAVSAAASDQLTPVLAADGSGGAVIAWFDYRSGGADIYAQRMHSGGAAQWTVNGAAVSTAFNDQSYPLITADGSGGAIITWQDFRSGLNTDVYAQRMSGAGVPQWTFNGVAICTAGHYQYVSAIVSDGNGGAIAAWYDFRSTSNYDIYAQRIERFGYLGSPEPAIAGVKDVPNDQGGKVKLSWDASYLDGLTDPNLYAYDVLRSVPPNQALAAIRSGARVVSDPAGLASAPTGDFLVTRDASATYYWEFLTSVSPLHYVSGYSYLAPTAEDSTGAGNPRTYYMVVGRNYGQTMYWLSAPDSGYSVDNLPPSAPSPFAGAYFAGATHLHWGANSEADLAGYRLYRGSSSGFVPGPGNLVTAQPDTGYDDSGAAGSWYKLSAIDSHGNESLFAILGPAGTTDAPGVGAFTLAFARPAPDPAFGGEVTLRFTLPREGPATLVVMDTQGRLMRRLVSGRRPGGENVVRWDLTSDRGEAVPAGIYFLRLSAEGRTLTRSMVALE